MADDTYSIGGIVSAILILVIGVGGYMLPSIVAERRKHRNTLAISMMNIVLGWTVLFWIWALIWACTSPSANQTIIVHMNEPPRT